MAERLARVVDSRVGGLGNNGPRDAGAWGCACYFGSSTAASINSVQRRGQSSSWDRLATRPKDRQWVVVSKLHCGKEKKSLFLKKCRSRPTTYAVTAWGIE